MFKFMVRLIVLGVCLVGTSLRANESEHCNDVLSSRDAVILVPNRAGGGYDTYARAIAPELSNQTGLNIRVINNEAGGGLVANNIALNADTDSLIMLIANLADLASTPLVTDRHANMLSAFDVVGILAVEPRAWVVTDVLDVKDMSLTSLVAAEGSIEDAIIPSILAGLSLGLEVEVVPGYSGTSDFIGAVLRGEADMISISLQTALRHTADLPIHPALILSDAPTAEAPNVPYLAGPGGLADLRSVGLPDEIRAQRQNYAEIAVYMGQSARGIVISQNVGNDILDCLREGFSGSVSSPSLQAALEMQGRTLDPIVGSEAVAYSVRLATTARQNGQLIDNLLREQ